MARLGLGAGWTCAFANDFDPGKAAAYRANFGDDHLFHGDVWELRADQLPGRADLAWASSPCQDFSLAGGRAGLTGGRSSAFFGFWRLMSALKQAGRAPRTIVIENVVGLLTSHGGADFTALCEALAGQGYRFGALEIDAALFKPQSRPRVFIVATLNEPAKAVDEPVKPFHSRAICAAWACLPSEVRRNWVWWSLPLPPGRNTALVDFLEEDRPALWNSPDRTERLIGLMSEQHRKRLRDAQLSRQVSYATAFRRMRSVHGVKIQRAEPRLDGLAGCLRTSGGGSSRQFVIRISHTDFESRLLTPREAARLMGLEDDYQLPPSATEAFKLLGDGVVVDVVRWLRQNLIDQLAQSSAAPDNVVLLRERRATG